MRSPMYKHTHSKQNVIKHWTMLWVWPVCCRAVVPNLGVRVPHVSHNLLLNSLHSVTLLPFKGPQVKKAGNHYYRGAAAEMHNMYCSEQYLKITLTIKQFSSKHNPVKQMAYKLIYTSLLWYFVSPGLYVCYFIYSAKQRAFSLLHFHLWTQCVTM